MRLCIVLANLECSTFCRTDMHWCMSRAHLLHQSLRQWRPPGTWTSCLGAGLEILEARLRTVAPAGGSAAAPVFAIACSSAALRTAAASNMMVAAPVRFVPSCVLPTIYLVFASCFCASRSGGPSLRLHRLSRSGFHWCSVQVAVCSRYRSAPDAYLVNPSLSQRLLLLLSSLPWWFVFPALPLPPFALHRLRLSHPPWVTFCFLLPSLDDAWTALYSYRSFWCIFCENEMWIKINTIK